MSALYLEGAAAVVLVAALLALARTAGWPGDDARGRRQARWMAAALALISLIPVNGLSAARLLLTLSPSLSVSTLTFSLAAILAVTVERPSFRVADLLALAGCVLAISAPLFASTLRLWPFDLYSLGYRFSWLDVAVAAIGILAAWRGWFVVAAVVLAGFVVQSARVLPSENLFDALTDGLAFFIALAVVGPASAGWLADRQRAPSHGPPGDANGHR